MADHEWKHPMFNSGQGSLLHVIPHLSPPSLPVYCQLSNKGTKIHKKIPQYVFVTACSESLTWTTEMCRTITLFYTFLLSKWRIWLSSLSWYDSGLSPALLSCCSSTSHRSKCIAVIDCWLRQPVIQQTVFSYCWFCISRSHYFPLSFLFAVQHPKIPHTQTSFPHWWPCGKQECLYLKSIIQPSVT